MLDVELRDHVGDIMKVFLRRHPVTGFANSLIGYCNPSDKKLPWSLIVQHRLKPSHIDELDDLMPKVMKDAADARRNLDV